jgi:UDP-glucose 4-epimerase
VFEGILAVIQTSGVEGEVFNIGSGRATSVNLLAKEVLSLAGVDLEIQHEESRAGDIKDSYADISKVKRLLGFEPKVSLREGLKAIV